MREALYKTLKPQSMIFILLEILSTVFFSYKILGPNIERILSFLPDAFQNSMFLGTILIFVLVISIGSTIMYLLTRLNQKLENEQFSYGKGIIWGIFGFIFSWILLLVWITIFENFNIQDSGLIMLSEQLLFFITVIFFYNFGLRQKKHSTAAGSKNFD